MHHYLTLLTHSLVISLSLLASAAMSEELKGKVTAATETSVEVVMDSDYLPNVGDKVEIYFAIPGLDETATVALGTVAELRGELVVVTIEKANGKIVNNQFAKIASDHPQKKGTPAAATATATAAPPIAPPVSATPAHQLTLVSAVLSELDIPQIVTVNADGTGLQVLTDTNVVWNTYPAWSPDGNQIVFSSGDSGLLVMNSDGTNSRQVAEGAATHAAWSPDGKRIAFTRYLQGSFQAQILVAPVSDGIAAGEPLTTPIDDNTTDQFPAWSPDGKQILFVSNRGGAFSLHTMDTDGQNMHELLRTNYQLLDACACPAWSPDGKQIVYTDGSPNGTQQLFRINADGSQKVQLTNLEGICTFAAWSPDGTMIAYLYDEGGEKVTLYVINADGSNPRALLDKQCTFSGSRPNWKPIK